MIVISAVLVFAAMILLVLGVFVVKMLLLVYISIGASVFAAILLGIGAFLQRDAIFSGDDTLDRTGSGDQSGSASRKKVTAGVATSGGGSAGGTGGAGGVQGAPGSTRKPGEATRVGTSPPAVQVPVDARVYVVPGRRGYHLPSCRQLSKKDKTELTYAEAVEQGYSACTACLPDTALAARTGATETEETEERAELHPEPDEASTSSVGTVDGQEVSPAVEVADGSGPLSAESDPAEGTEHIDGQDRAGNGEDPSASESVADVDPGDTGDPDTVNSEDDSDEEEPSRAGLVGVVQGRNRYHRLTCAVVEDAVHDGIELNTMGRDEAAQEGLTPCTVCRP